MHLYSLIRPRSGSRGPAYLGFSALLSATLILGACADDDDGDAVGDTDVTETPVATDPAETPTDADTETATPTETAEDGAETPTPTVFAPEIVERENISFVAPEGWRGNADTWTAPETDVTLLFASREREPGTEPEALMLPEGATNLDREDIETPIGSGGLYTIEMADENVYERHAIVMGEDRIYDWWLVAESVEELDEHQEALDGVLESILREDEE